MTNSTLPPPIPRRSFHLLWAVPAIALIAVSVLFRAANWDLDLATRYFDKSTGAFVGNQSAWVRFCYEYAGVPAFLIGIACLLLLAAGFFWPRAKEWRRVCGYFVVAGILGPGLIVNTTLKDNWGRPRPVQVIDFAGTEVFLPVGTPSSFREGRAFPSGHASIAFFLMSPFFVLLARKRTWAIALLLLGLAWGFAVGLGRIAQGGHWTSDVIWACGIVYLTCFATARAFGLLRASPTPIQAKNE